MKFIINLVTILGTILYLTFVGLLIWGLWLGIQALQKYVNG